MDNICLICINSTRSAIGDSFKNICNNITNKKNVYIIKSNSYSTNEFDYDKNNILDINFNKKNVLTSINMKRWIEIQNFIKKNKIAHIFFYSDNPLNSVIKILNKDINYSFWWHDPIPHSGVSIKFKILRFLNDKVLLNSRKLKNIIVASQHLKELILENKKIEKERIKVIYLPYMEEITKYIKQDYFEYKYQFIFWGRIESYKGLDVLEKAVEKLVTEGYKFKLLIVGKGDLSKVTNGILENLEDYVDIVNEYVSNKSLANYISTSQVAIFPYKDSTATQTVQTALYFGCNVIATDTGSFKEYLALTEESTIYKIANPSDYVSLYSAMKYYLDNEIKKVDRNLISENFEKSFNNKNMANKLYKSLI